MSLGVPPPSRTGAAGQWYAWAVQTIKDLQAEVQALRAQVAAQTGPTFTTQYQAPDPRAEVPTAASLTANLTLTSGDLRQMWNFSPTASRTVTLPTPDSGDWIEIFNSANQTLTINDQSASTIVNLHYKEMIRLTANDLAGTPTWQASVVRFGQNGMVFSDQALHVMTGAAGIVLKDSSNANYYRITTVAGVVTSTSIGSTAPNGNSTPETPAS